jgi:lia operon protein LiaF
MRKSFSFTIGGALVFFGVVFLLDNLGIVDSEWIFDNFWPILLIVAGIALIGNQGKWHELHSPAESPNTSAVFTSADQSTQGDHFYESEVFGSIHRQLSSKNFTGGRCSVVFGDIKLDLTQVELSLGEQTLQFSTVFGNVRIVLPENLEYSVKANFVAGGVNVKGDRRGGVFQNIAVRSNGFTIADKKLAILASSVFGDIKIV